MTTTQTFTKGQPIAFRDVQGRRASGTVLSTHPMTGEVEVQTPRGVAYVTRDRIVPPAHTLTFQWQDRHGEWHTETMSDGYANSRISGLQDANRPVRMGDAMA